MVAGNTSANLLLKVGANDKLWLFGILGWRSLLGLTMFGLAVFAYAWALKFVPLSRAQYIAVLQYPLAIFLAAMFLGDRVSPMQWFGIALIVGGIVLSVRN